MGWKFTLIIAKDKQYGTETFAGRDYSNATPEGTYSALNQIKILEREFPHNEYYLMTYEVVPWGSGIRNVLIATPLPLSLEEVF